MLLYIITALVSKVVEFHESPTSNQGEPPNPAPSTISTSELTINKDEPPVSNARSTKNIIALSQLGLKES